MNITSNPSSTRSAQFLCHRALLNHKLGNPQHGGQKRNLQPAGFPDFPLSWPQEADWQADVNLIAEGAFLACPGSDGEQSGLLQSLWGPPDSLAESDLDCVLNLYGIRGVLSQAPCLFHLKSYHLSSQGHHLGFLFLPVTSTKWKARFSRWQEV